jgi:predicted GNAT family acetyltransferase
MERLVDAMNWTRGAYTVTTDPALVDHSVVTSFLQDSYWSKGVPAPVVSKSIEGSLCFALRNETRQIGFARVISDRATVAHLNDVFVLPEFRGQGLGTWLMECVMAHPELQGLRVWILVTRDAHDLYKKFGFLPLGRPEGYMERRTPDVYRVAQQTHAASRDT